MNVDPFLGEGLVSISSGRLFSRRHMDRKNSFVGLVDLPASTPAEKQIPVIISEQGVVLITREARVPPEMVWGFGESGISHILTSFQWRRPAHEWASDAFVRESALPHADPLRRWMILAGVSDRPIRALGAGGLFELAANAPPRLVDEEPYAGLDMGGPLRQAIWGPKGKFGISTDMHLPTFHAWVEGERARNAKRDAKFLRYMTLMNEQAGSPPLFFTKEDKEARELVSKSVLRQVMSEEDETIDGNSPCA